MNGLARFNLVVLLVVVLTACAVPAQPSPTLAPTQTTPPPTSPPTSLPVTPTLPHPDHTLLATDKLASSGGYPPVFFTLPSMDQVTIANVPYKKGLTMDIYYPPEFDFSSPVPAVIFINGFGMIDNTKFKDLGMYVSWAQIAAASGMVGINYETLNHLRDTRDLLNFIRANASSLGVDKDHLCLWSSSSNTPIALDVISNKDAEYQDGLSCAVIYYGSTKTTNYLPPDLSFLIVKAGQDDQFTNADLDTFVSTAKAAGLSVELIEYKEGKHAFDVYQDTDETRAIVSRTLEFMKEKLTTP